LAVEALVWSGNLIMGCNARIFPSFLLFSLNHIDC
jgi:hypothetical protein